MRQFFFIVMAILAVVTIVSPANASLTDRNAIKNGSFENGLIGHVVRMGEGGHALPISMTSSFDAHEEKYYPTDGQYFLNIGIGTGDNDIVLLTEETTYPQEEISTIKIKFNYATNLLYGEEVAEEDKVNRLFWIRVNSTLYPFNFNETSRCWLDGEVLLPGKTLHNVSIYIYGDADLPDGIDLSIDNFRIEREAVPEPATASMAILGLAFICWVTGRRRRRHPIVEVN